MQHLWIKEEIPPHEYFNGYGNSCPVEDYFNFENPSCKFINNKHIINLIKRSNKQTNPKLFPKGEILVN